jgi:hypothetical protein
MNPSTVSAGLLKHQSGEEEWLLAGPIQSGRLDPITKAGRSRNNYEDQKTKEKICENVLISKCLLCQPRSGSGPIRSAGEGAASVLNLAAEHLVDPLRTAERR